MVDKSAWVNNYTRMLENDDVTPDLWSVHFKFQQPLTGGLPEKLSEALEDVALAVSLHNQEATDGDNWTVSLTTDGPPDVEEIFQRITAVAAAEKISKLLDKADITAERVPQQDWLQHVYDRFPPLTIGRFFVQDSYYQGAVPEGLVKLQIDAATAFGSGEHQTTRGCIEAFESLAQNKFENGLDMGCGSGILAIALAKLWPRMKVTAIDIEDESIVVTGRHAEMNNVQGHIATQAGNGYAAPLVAENGPYDIIAANILANPLIEMAPALMQSLKSGGYAVLSGLLSRQKDDVIAAHEKQGLKLVQARTLGDWETLVLQKP